MVILCYPIPFRTTWLDQINTPRFSTEIKEFEEAEKEVNKRLEELMAVKGNLTVDTLHKRLGKIMWDYVGMARNKEGLELAIEEIQKSEGGFLE